MKRLLLVVLLCMGIKSPAQQYFNKRDPLHSFFSNIRSVAAIGGNYYTVSWSWDSINYIGNNLAWSIEGINFAKFDKYGNRILDTNYQKNDRDITPGFGKLLPQPDNTILVAGDQIDTSGNRYLTIMRFDTTGRMLWTKEMLKPFCVGISNDFLRLADFRSDGFGNWLVLSRISCRPPLQLDIVLTKLNASFNVIWHKQLGVSNMDDAGWKLLVEPDGYLIAGGRNNLYQVQKNFSCRAMLMKTDTAGNVQWEWLSDPSKKTFEAKDVIRTQDGGYVYCGQGDGVEYLSANGTYGTLGFRGWVEKLDSNRNVVWSKAYGKARYNTEFKRIIETPDGRLLLFGDKYMPDIFGPDTVIEHTRGWFMTLSANGDSLRERTYFNTHSCNDANLFYDAQPTDDGGFVMCGEATDRCFGYTPPTQRGWLVKVDSNGCLGPGDPQCWPTSVPQLTALPGITVHPNPVHDQWWVTNPAAQPIDISILDLTGRVLIKTSSAAAEVPLNLGHLAPAIYLYRIQNKQGALLQGKILKE